MSIWWIRHTRVAVAPGTCYGRTEVPLVETFAEEAARVRAALPAPPRLVWSSPAARCRRLAETWGGPVRVDARLAELDFGAWEGRLWATFHDEESEAWAQDPWGRSPPGGETGHEMLARVTEVADEIRAEAVGRDGVVAVVTHAGVLRAWRHVRGYGNREAVLTWTVPFGSVWEEVVG